MLPRVKRMSPRATEAQPVVSNPTSLPAPAGAEEVHDLHRLNAFLPSQPHNIPPINRSTSSASGGCALDGSTRKCFANDRHRSWRWS